MLELLVCSMVTILPDYLFRRFVQGKKFGKEITLYSVWYELRWGITACLVLTISLITMIFYYHPQSTNVTSLFRTVTILPEVPGRVDEVYVTINQKVEAGAPLFRLDSSKQEAAVETARRQVAEIDAQMEVTEADLAAADGQIEQAKSAYQQALDEYNTKSELFERNAALAVSEREVERLRVAVDGRSGAVDAAIANKQALQSKLSSLLPAQKQSAEAARDQAQVELDKTTVRAGVAGTVSQFALRTGDVVNPLIRPAGILIPDAAGYTMIAGFGQIEAQVMKPGMLGEVTCSAQPFSIIPVVVTDVQAVIAAGQFKPSDQLIDLAQTANPGTLTVFMDSLYPGQLFDIPPGSLCIANAYTSNEERLATDPNLGTLTKVWLHVVDATGMVHAMILRLQAILLPVRTLVLSGGH